MSDTAPGAMYREAFTLRDGSAALIRIADSQDSDKFNAAFGKLDQQSIYTRFFQIKKALSAADLSRLAATDASANLVLAACLGQAPDEVVIGAASYAALPLRDGLRAVEVAFTIEEDYQRQGLASRLLAALIGLARQHGIAFFEAEVLMENSPMLAVFKRSGLPLKITRESGVRHLVMDLRLTAGGDALA